MLLIYKTLRSYLRQKRSYAFKGMVRKRANALGIKICKIPIIRDTE
ncbi:hypothetical protein [Helicobacter pylori]|nr:hypothetical protein [Helicobacter pylori]